MGTTARERGTVVANSIAVWILATVALMQLQALLVPIDDQGAFAGATEHVPIETRRVVAYAYSAQHDRAYIAVEPKP